MGPPIPFLKFKKKVKENAEMAVKTKVLHLRVSAIEAAALDELANTLGVKKSEILRRHLREAVRTGPSYFKDGFTTQSESDSRQAQFIRIT